MSLPRVSPRTIKPDAPIDTRVQRNIRTPRYYQVQDARYVPDHDRGRNRIVEEKGGRYLYCR